MRGIKKLSAWTLSVIGVATMASTASAVSFRSSGSADSSGGGAVVRTLSPSSNTFCYLSMVFVREPDGETAACYVTRGGTNWTLTAYSDSGSASSANCAAICYNN